MAFKFRAERRRCIGRAEFGYVFSRTPHHSFSYCRALGLLSTASSSRITPFPLPIPWHIYDLIRQMEKDLAPTTA